MNSIKVAVETGDSEKLSEDINFPLVRQNLKEQLSAAMATNARDELSDNPFAALAIAFSDKLVEGMLDTFVTPSGIASLISGRNPQYLIGEQVIAAPIIYSLRKMKVSKMEFQKIYETFKN